MKHVHPFPARMAPELALRSISGLPPRATVLDPMAGAGTVLRHAVETGHRAIGFDLDPLAVLMAKVWTTPINPQKLARLADKVINSAKRLSEEAETILPWIDEDEETSKFVEYWFGEAQRDGLRRVSRALGQAGDAWRNQPEIEVLRLALSRLIITKDRGASLARDISHSRPHKVREHSDFDVLKEFQISARQLERYLRSHPPSGEAEVSLGDARDLTYQSNNSIDAVITSPPYLNAIDYMRGHKLSLIWLGYKLAELRTIRAKSIGTERAPESGFDHRLFDSITTSMTTMERLSKRHQHMVERYAEDVYRMMSEIARVLKRQRPCRASRR